MLTPEQLEQNKARMIELMDNADIRHKIQWKMEKMIKRGKKSSCVCCNQNAAGTGVFLLHKSKNKECGLEENKERLFLYYACEKHMEDSDGINQIEKSIFDNTGKDFTYIDVE